MLSQGAIAQPIRALIVSPRSPSVDLKTEDQSPVTKHPSTAPQVGHQADPRALAHHTITTVHTSLSPRGAHHMALEMLCLAQALLLG